MLRVLIVAALLVVPQGAGAQNKAQLTHDSRKMLSAFICSVYATHAKRMVEAPQLFELGLSSGRAFMSAVREKEHPKDDLAGVPMIILGNLWGPSADFSIGQIYAWASAEAYTDIVGRNAIGTPLPIESRITDERTIEVIAENKYTKANCSFLK